MIKILSSKREKKRKKIIEITINHFEDPKMSLPKQNCLIKQILKSPGQTPGPEKLKMNENVRKKKKKKKEERKIKKGRKIK